MTTIKTPGYPDFKISNPFEPGRELHAALKEAMKADKLAEFAHMRLSEIYRRLKFQIDADLTPEGKRAVEYLDKATDALSNARAEFSDAVYDIGKVLDLSGL